MASRGVVPIQPGCGGSELAAYQLACFFARQGNQVTLVADVGAGNGVLEPNLEFIPIQSRAQRLVARLPGGFFTWMLQHLIGNVTAAVRTVRLIHDREFDVVHAHGNLAAILISFCTRLPLIYTEQDAPPWQCRYRRWWERLIRTAIYRALNVTAFKRADHVVATFEPLRTEIVGRWGVPAANVSVIPNGAPEEFSRPVNGNGSANGGLPRGFDHYCLFVGRLTDRKAPDFVVRALVEADDVCCVFAGDGPLRRHVEHLAEDLGVAERTAFLGNVDPGSLGPLYTSADLLILPSVSEASPLVVTEAMACGTPVLATRIAGIPSLVEDWETGFLVHPDNIGELAVALRFLMRDGQLRKRMSENARARASERFLWSGLGRQYQAIYESFNGHSPAADDRKEASESEPSRLLPELGFDGSSAEGATLQGAVLEDIVLEEAVPEESRA
jgi:glycosyltransferase involved in cell wall biosynthesis